MLKGWKLLLVGAAVMTAGSAWGSSFVSNDDGTITATTTGVEWAADASSPTVNSCSGGALTWEQAQAYIDCINDAEYLGNTDWRLPTADDFAALAGNQNLATGLKNSAYWTGTVFGADGTDAYAYNLGTGAATKVSKARHLPVWPVRDAGSSAELHVTGPASAIASATTVPVVRYNVTVIQGLNGKITPGTLPPIKAGTKKTFTVTPNKKFIIKSVTVNGLAQDLTDKDLAKPYKITLKIEADTTITAEFDDAPKVSGFPTKLPEGDYKLDVQYCVKVPGYINKCESIDGSIVHFDAETASYFYDYFNNFFDKYYTQYAGTGCKAKSSCSKYSTTTGKFDCKISITCGYGGYSATAYVDYIFTKQ